jgi:hypothetical protein
MNENLLNKHTQTQLLTCGRGPNVALLLRRKSLSRCFVFKGFILRYQVPPLSCIISLGVPIPAALNPLTSPAVDIFVIVAIITAIIVHSDAWRSRSFPSAHSRYNATTTATASTFATACDVCGVAMRLSTLATCYRQRSRRSISTGNVTSQSGHRRSHQGMTVVPHLSRLASSSVCCDGAAAGTVTKPLVAHAFG